MNGWRRATVSAAILVPLWTLGCSTPPKGQGTPKETVAKWQKAIADGDKRAFIECYQTGKKREELAGAMYEAVRAAIAFKKALVDARGPDAWAKFTGTEIDLGGLAFQIIDPPPTDPEVLEKCTFEEKGGEVIVRGPKIGAVMMSVGGAWRISLGVVEEYEDKWIERFSKMARILRDHLAETRAADANVVELKRKILVELNG